LQKIVAFCRLRQFELARNRCVPQLSARLSLIRHIPLMSLPLRLGKQPLLESLFEVRFNTPTIPVADLLPGVIFSSLGQHYKSTEILPLASLPKELRANEPNLQFAATQRISGPEAVIFFGDNVIGLSKSLPYRGWPDFRERIFAFVDVVQQSGLITEISRYSLKAVNVIQSTETRQLDHLAIEVSLAGSQAMDNGFHLRTELNDANILRIVEITPNTTMKTSHNSLHSGLRVVIDCIRPCSPSGNCWTDLKIGLDALHDEQKRLFFKLLTPNTLAALEPEYA
jgi:uncharacterized protein (TIGR04255 family)